MASSSFGISCPREGLVNRRTLYYYQFSPLLKRRCSPAPRTEKSGWIFAMARLCILGSGAWGTAVSLVLGQKAEHEVCLWSARPEKAKVLHERRENVRLLPGVPIPPAILLTCD